ncbi:protein transporter SEC24 [Tremella mesenterica]|uniref:Protein transporter SEC24 n=1 Tax=Tremella mesenterica TaxID=5217 RepID=A0A4V1M4D3_TREME|nr:protein transporter SEC24 [Tremella mesenterica]
MSSEPLNLPQGWEARWDAQSSAYIYIDQSTGQAQWELPTQPSYPTSHHSTSSSAPAPAPAPAPVSRPGRRHYPTAQIQQMYAGGGYDQPPPVQPLAPGYGDQTHVAPQFFTPGMADVQQAQIPQGQFQQPAYGQQPAYPQEKGVDQMTNQFQNMQMGYRAGATYGDQKQLHSIQTVNLIGMQPDVRGLDSPPPAALLAPNAAVTQSPHIQPDPSYQRCTLAAMPTTQSLLNKSKLPLALVLAPYRSVREVDDDMPVPVVEDSVIARCRRCRAYINPFVTFIEGGNRWKCCMCGLSNEVPQLFDWDQRENKPADRWGRKELNHAVVEYIAPTEYMVRPPQPPVYAFVIDVSQSAVQSGMVATAARTILENLDNLPNADKRTKIAIIAVSTSLHFMSLPPGSTEASMLVVSDLTDVFLPKPVDLLVNLTESRPAIETLLGRLSDMFQEPQVGNALGSALQAAHQLIGKIGGKIIALTSCLPSLGEGALKARDDPKLLGTSKESSLLNAASSWYKTFAIECSKQQVAVDMFLFSASYTDVATLSCLPRYTAGQTYLYPGFNASRSEDAIKFATEFGRVLSMPIGLEAVIRVRATRGIRLAAFHGNFFIRSTDLLALPVVPMDQNYVIELQLEDDVKATTVVIQTAVLHTTCFGERRIRVITQAMPTTDSIAEMYGSADQIAIASYLVSKSVEKSMTSSLDDARNLIINKLSDMLTVFKNQVTSSAGASAQLAVPDNLKLLPLLMCGLVKHVGLREGVSIPPDLRSYAQALLTTLPCQSLIPYIHPIFYSLHNMSPDAGTVGPDGHMVLPPALNLTSERLERHGLFFIEDGQNMFLWVGHEAVPRLIQDVFDLPSYAELTGGKYTLPVLDNPFNQRVNNIVAKTRELRRGVYRQHLYVVKSDAEPALRSWALSCLIEDRMDKMGSYAQFLTQVKNKVSRV